MKLLKDREVESKQKAAGFGKHVIILRTPHEGWNPTELTLHRAQEQVQH